MTLLIKITLVMLIALFTGLGSAYFAIDTGLRFGRLIVGPWIASPDTGAAQNDPYFAASLARTGEIVLGLGEGITFVAATDSQGNDLSGACDYQIIGNFPASRLWTLTVHSSSYKPMIEDPFVPGFYNSNILRKSDGSFELTIASKAQPGNWLPIDADNEFQLVARLYDTALVSSGVRIVEPQMPQIKRLGCEA